MNKNLALFIALVAGIFIFGLVVMLHVPRREVIAQTVPVTAKTAIVSAATTGEPWHSV